MAAELPTLALRTTCKQQVRSWRLRFAMTAVLLAFSLPFANGAGTAPGASPTARVGSPAPDFTLQLLDGKKITLSSLKGKAVVLNFWHSG